MAKLDWKKANCREIDPALVLRDRGDTTLANTPTAHKERKQAAKARSKAARQAAKTRKLDREKRQQDEAVRARDALVSRVHEVTFWSRLKASMAAANQERRERQAKVK